jgi:ribosomal protein L34
MPKRTFQPNRRHRAKTHGFLTRMKTKAGAAVLSDAHEDQSGSSSAFPPPRQGSQARFRECRLPRLAQLDSNCDVEYAPYPGFPVRSSRHVRVCGFLLRKAA